MFQGIHSLKKNIKQRSKSQNVTNGNELGMTKSFLSTKLSKIQQQPSCKPFQLNMLLNGQSIKNVIASKQKGKTVANSPKNITNLKQFIYRKYLTEHQEDMQPHVQAIIRLRQMFNQRCKSRNFSEGKDSERSEQVDKWPKIEVRKIASITNPDLNTISYIKRSKKYENPPCTPVPFRYRQIRIIRQRNFEKKDIMIQSSQERSSQQTIDAWETD